MSSKINSDGGGGQTSKSNSFDSFPFDNGFRNYMARKIELQRKQFGLIVPPPPPIAELPPALLKNANTFTSEASGYASGNSHVSTPKLADANLTKKRKSVQFHENVDVEGVSQVLEKLKQKHPDKRPSGLPSEHSRRKLRRSTSDRESPTEDDPAISPTVDEVTSKSDNECDSILGVLDNLQKRHGTSFFGKKRRSRSKGRSSLGGLEPVLDESSSQEEDESATYNSLGQGSAEEYLDSGISQLQHSPASTAAAQRQMTPIKTAKNLNHRPDLFFTGVVVLVNGHTSPDATTLMRLLHKHGGDLDKYETRRVTHIIAEQLSTAKANIYIHQKKPTPVCRPEWITNSVKCGKLLPFGDYLLENVCAANVIGSKSVKSFFHPNPKCKHALREDDKLNDNASLPHKVAKQECTTSEPKSHQRWHDTNPSKANFFLNEHVRTVGNDPNFLESYFSNSRLSYIGSFKQRVKPTKQAACTQVIDGSTRFVLLVDMDCFFASVALRRYPQYADKPVAVGHSHVERTNASGNTTRIKNSTSELSTCNYIARKHGIRKGMFLGDAIALCPDLVVLPYDFVGFEEVSGVVGDILHVYAEQYNGCVEQVSCDESYVEININSNDTGDDIYAFANSLAESIRTDIVRSTSCTASIGIGPNKLLAKLAADRVKPNACCVVRDWREFLENRSLRDIPSIGHKLEMKLKPYGLSTVNDIWDLGQDAVSVVGEIIGAKIATKIVQFCFGTDDRQVTPAIRKSIGAECNYGVRFDGPYGVDYMMQGLAKEVHRRMVSAAVRGSKLVLKVMKSKDPSKQPGKFLGHGSCDSLSRSADISLTRDKDVIFSAAMKLYAKIGVNVSNVRGIGIVISSLKSDDKDSTLNSSPSKLSEWLRKDMSATICDSSFASLQRSLVVSSDFASMPSFSQLDQDVLSNLPEDILMEVRATYRSKSRNQTSCNISKTLSPLKSNQHDNPIPIAGQASVRRMLKLACIKSGANMLGSNNFRLSQLDCLPMELQLQLANEDDVQVIKRSKRKGEKNPATSHNDTAHDEMLSVRTSQVEERGRVSPQKQSSNNFYHENIIPLQDLILSNPNPEREVVDTVKDFLSLCINERRVDDAATFLRAIKNMSNGWDHNLYSGLRKSILDQITSTTGDVLDVRWLGL